MRTKTFTKSTILSAFEKIGLIPCKPEKALNSLREKLQKKSKSATPSPTYSHTITSTWPTPYNLPELHDYAAQMCNTLESIESGSRRVVAKGGVLTENEAADIIRSRLMNEVEQARHKKQL